MLSSSYEHYNKLWCLAGEARVLAWQHPAGPHNKEPRQSSQYKHLCCSLAIVKALNNVCLAVELCHILCCLSIYILGGAVGSTAQADANG